MKYETILQSEKIVETIKRLETRIEDRFPGSGLGQVCHKLLSISQKAQERSVQIGQPIIWLRTLAIGLCAALILITISPLFYLGHTKEELKQSDFIQLLDSGSNVVVLLGAAVLFLVTLEKRYKRQRALGAIHELRSISHIIDMHQLTKDPERLSPRQFISLGTSPKISMSRFQLQRYLDYCSELLSLTGKVAAVYVQRFDDPVALASASEVESMTSGLTGKIWQKILILHSFEEKPE